LDCRNLSSDYFNCGACGNVCFGTPLTVACAGGQCVCQPGLTRCGNACVNTNFDRNNCGACGVVCAPDQVCAFGRCL